MRFRITIETLDLTPSKYAVSNSETDLIIHDVDILSPEIVGEHIRLAASYLRKETEAKTSKEEKVDASS